MRVRRTARPQLNVLQHLCVCVSSSANKQCVSLQGSKDDDFRLPYLSHQQLPAGILPMVPEVAQAVGACQGPQAKDYGRALPNPGKTTMTAMIANELLYAGSSLTAEAILKARGPMNQLPLGPLARPSEQLGYLAAVQGLQVTPPPTSSSSLIDLLRAGSHVCFFSPQVEYKDFPKNNKNEFVSLINCSSQPPLISHGIGKDVESCHDMVSSHSQWPSGRVSP